MPRPGNADLSVFIVEDEAQADEKVFVVNNEQVQGTPADGDFIVRQGGLWVPRTIVDADIPASIARDSEVTAAVAAEAALRSAADALLQPLDADLSALAALSPANGDVVYRSGGAWVNGSPLVAGLVANGRFPIGLTQNIAFAGHADNAGYKATIPGTTISAVVKCYTVPAGYYAIVRPAFTNTDSSAHVINVFAMDDGSTPVANDRFNTTSISATNSSSVGGDMVLDEGATLWAYTDDSGSPTHVNFTPFVTLIPKTGLVPTLTVRNFKQLAANSDTQVYPVSPAVIAAGRWAQQFQIGALSNTTGSAIIITTKMQRAGDGAAFTVDTRSLAANGTASWMGGNGSLQGSLQAGDKIFINPSATGVNFWSAFAERAL